MSVDKFDVIVVGGGPAGSTAALVAAREGLSVLLIDRGRECGTKNMTGGRLYAHSLEKVLPGFAKTAPVERKVTHEKISVMTPESSLDIGYSSAKTGASEETAAACASYTVLRGPFDKWLSGEAKKAGAEVVPGYRVDRLLVNESGAVCGVGVEDEELYSDVVILADGVNSLLSQQLGMKKELTPEQAAVGAKEVIRLGEKTINERFGLKSGEGTAWLSVGDPTKGAFGGGLLYTNKDTVSVGIVATLSDIGHNELSVPEMLSRFKEHPSIAPYLEGGEVIEYSAHLVPEAGIHMLPELYRDGVMIAGDAAGLCINLGFTVRGMDFAIESGRLAAEAAVRAHRLQSFSADTLSFYERLMKNSFIMDELDSMKGFPTLLSRREIFETFPQMADEIASGIFTVTGESSKGILMNTVTSLASHMTVSQLTNLISTITEAF